MMNLQTILENDINLPSLPGIAVRILQAVKDDESSFAELSVIISSDPALSARVLQIANSPFYPSSENITNIEKAISILGVNLLKNIALSFVIVRDMYGPAKGGFDFNFFWKRAVTSAVAAELLSELFDRKSDDTFVTALLQDIGIVILYQCRTDDYLKVLDEKRASSLPISAVEEKIFGFGHHELGAELLKKWGIPENIYQPIRYHHTEKNIPKNHRALAEVLRYSDSISSIYLGSGSASKLQNLRTALVNEFHLEEQKITELIDDVARNTSEILSFFEIDPEGMLPFSELLLEANEELGKLNLSYEQLLLELKQEKEKTETLAKALKNSNDKLQRLASTDELTGLFNRRHFMSMMKSEISRAVRYNRPLSFIIFDIDFFKKVNDTYGHPAGDRVLAEVSWRIGENIRNTEILARYGGEEFAIILPETSIKDAALLAERLRRSIERMEVTADQTRISNITISLGVTTFIPDKGLKSEEEIIQAADKALYNAKNTGRNKVSIAGWGGV
ncbi:HDOD domain-containing protein [Thermodesulfobacteriota bacterium]